MKTKGKKTSFRDKLAKLISKANKTTDAAELKTIQDDIEEMVENGGEDTVEEDGGGTRDVHIHINGTAGTEEKTAKTTDSEGDGSDERWAKNDAEHVDFTNRIKALENAIAKLIGGEESNNVKDEQKLEEEMRDELPEELVKEGLETKDSRYLEHLFRDAASKAEIIAPGAVTIPSFSFTARPLDTYRQIVGIRRDALNTCYKDSIGKRVINTVFGGVPKLDKLDARQVKTLFNTVGALRATGNNTVIHDSAALLNQHNGGREQKRTVNSLADLNKLNAEKFGIK
jgi:uncharacterized protein YhfF